MTKLFLLKSTHSLPFQSSHKTGGVLCTSRWRFLTSNDLCDKEYVQVKTNKIQCILIYSVQVRSCRSSTLNPTTVPRLTCYKSLADLAPFPHCLDLTSYSSPNPAPVTRASLHLLHSGKALVPAFSWGCPLPHMFSLQTPTWLTLPLAFA